jgi:uncharacterized protein YhaN
MPRVNKTERAKKEAEKEAKKAEEQAKEEAKGEYENTLHTLGAENGVEPEAADKMEAAIEQYLEKGGNPFELDIPVDIVSHVVLKVAMTVKEVPKPEPAKPPRPQDYLKVNPKDLGTFAHRSL